MRKLLYGILGLVILLIIAAVVGPGLIDWNGFKGEIASQAKQLTGRELRIGGDIDLGLLPSPRLAAKDVRIANIAGAASPDMVRVDSIAVEVRLIPLLSGRVEVAGIRLVNPVVEFERLADGRVNWQLEQASDGRPPAPPGGGGPAKPGGGDSQSFRLDRLTVENGTIVYRDRGRVVERVERLTGEFAAESLAGPFRAKGSVVAHNTPLTFDASVGALGDATSAPVRVALGLADSDADIRLTGTASDFQDGPRFQGRLQLKADDLNRLLLQKGSGAAQPVFAQGQVDGTPKQVTVRELEVQVGDTRATGSVDARLGDRTEADVVLKVGRVNLDKLLAAGSDARPSTPAVPPASQPSAGRATTAGQPAKGDDGFTLPVDIKASLDLTVDTVVYKGAAIREAGVTAALDKGEAEIKRIGAVLPGGGRVGLTGRLKAVDGKPSFLGNLEAAADNLRVLLGWLGVDVDDVPADRLRTLRLNTRLNADPTQVQLLDLDAVLDAARISGGVTYALRTRPAFGASLSIDQFNADAYLPTAPPAGRSTAPGVQSGSNSAPQKDGAAATAGPGLAALNEFDANIALRIGTLTYRATAVQGLALDATLFNGALNVREARVRNIAGTSLGLKGEVAGLAGLASFKGTIEGESRDLTGLLRLAGVSTGTPGRAIGPAKLSGRADAAQDRVKIDAKLDLAGLAATLDAGLSGLNATLRVDLAINASHPDLAQLAATFGMGAAPLRGRGQFAVKARGTFEGIDLDTKFEAAGASFTAAGKIADPMERGAVDLALTLNHPDFAQLMRAFDPGYQPAEARPGAFEMKAAVTGDNQALNVSGLRLAIGQMTLGGDATLALAGSRPKLTAKLDGGHLDLNRILPPAKTSPRPSGAQAAAAPAPGPGGGQSSGSPFTREPIDVSALGDADADVRVASRSITYRNFRIEEPRIALALSDRVLKVNELIGRTFDGGFDMKAEVDGRSTPKLEATLKIDRANVGKALFDAADVDLAKGTLALDLSIAGSGKTSQDIASSLNGAGKLSVTDGSIKGFSLRAASDQLKNIDRITDLLGFFQAAMAGGETPFSSLTGTFNIDKGVLRTDDTKLIADAGAGDLKGTVDLGRWDMDMMAWFHLTEHRNSPPFGMRLQGPPDNPRRIFDFNDLQRFLVGRSVGTLLRKVAPQQPIQPGAAQTPAPAQPQTQPPQQQQQQRQKPEDILRDLLKGLGRPRQ